MEPLLTAREYVDLRAAVGWPTMAAEEAATALEASLAVVTERDDDERLIGMARAVGDGFYAIVVDVMVAPAEQDHGVATTLLTRLLDHPRVKNAGHLALFAAPDAVELYESFGFAAEGGIYMRRT